MCCVFFEVGKEFLSIIKMSFGFKELGGNTDDGLQAKMCAKQK
jgi:hypothetical protein